MSYFLIILVVNCCWNTLYNIDLLELFMVVVVHIYLSKNTNEVVIGGGPNMISPPPPIMTKTRVPTGIHTTLKVTIRLWRGPSGIQNKKPPI